jgi:hypothetical protein
MAVRTDGWNPGAMGPACFRSSSGVTQRVPTLARQCNSGSDGWVDHGRQRSANALAIKCVKNLDISTTRARSAPARCAVVPGGAGVGVPAGGWRNESCLHRVVAVAGSSVIGD